jgi:hypothetical protein
MFGKRTNHAKPYPAAEVNEIRRMWAEQNLENRLSGMHHWIADQAEYQAKWRTVISVCVLANTVGIICQCLWAITR